MFKMRLEYDILWSSSRLFKNGFIWLSIYTCSDFVSIVLFNVRVTVIWNSYDAR